MQTPFLGSNGSNRAQWNAPLSRTFFRWGLAARQTMVLLAGGALLVYVYYPVIHRRNTPRNQGCAEKVRRLALALRQYLQDSDGYYPATTRRFKGEDGDTYAGVGWAHTLFPYVKRPAIFQCPSDETRPAVNLCSYALNSNLVSGKRPIQASELAVPSRTVVLAEISGVATDLTQPYDPQTGEGDGYSAAGNGKRGKGLYPTAPLGSHDRRMLPLWATGTMRDAPPGVNQTNMQSLEWVEKKFGTLEIRPQIHDGGRHLHGAFFALADGRVRWFQGRDVSNGANAKLATHPQNMKLGLAEGTRSRQSGATFSTR